MYEYNYSKGVFHGVFIEYFDDGQQSIIGGYKMGNKNGTWIWKYKDGVTALNGSYKNNIPVGSWYWIRANKSEMVNIDSPDADWVNKRIRERENINNQ